MGGDAEYPDAAGGVLDDCQDVGGGAVEQVDAEEIGGQDRVGLSMQKLRPRQPGPLRCWWDPRLGEDPTSTVEGATRMPRPASSPWIRR
jgi:hypothetical protein